MSEAVKPEETPVGAEPITVPETSAAAPEASTEAPATEVAPETAAAEPTSEPAEAQPEEGAKEETKEEKPEPKEITEGTLSKTHGGLLSFFKQKRFFYFQEEPVPEEKLKAYLQKDTSSRATAAYATQTGKGLLLYSKAESQKDAPNGIIKLADVSDVTSSGATKFALKLSSGELHFEAPPTERDNWVFTIKAKIAEAKTSSEAIAESEGYKAALEKLSKPAVVATTEKKAAEKAPEKPVETKEAENEEPKPETTETGETAPEATPVTEEAGSSETKDVKRTPSKKGKRSSVFAPFFAKKEKAEEKKEEKEEKKEETKEEPKPEEEAEPVAPTEVVAVAPLEAVEVPKAEEEAKPTEESKPVEEPAKPSESTTSPKPTKRNSFFGGLFKKDQATEEKKGKEVEPATETPVAAVDTTEGEASKPEEIPVEQPATEKSAASSPPKTKFLPNFFEKREKSPGPKAEKAAEKEPETTEEAVTEAPADAAAAPAEETPVSPAEPAVSPKEKRKSSFFGGFKKEKKPEEVKSDSEDAEPSSSKPATSPVPKGLLGGLMRKASRTTKSTGKESENKEVATPTTVAEETSAAPESAEPVTSEAKPAETMTSEGAPQIGDVVPDAVTVGQQPVQAAA